MKKRKKLIKKYFFPKTLGGYNYLENNSSKDDCEIYYISDIHIDKLFKEDMSFEEKRDIVEEIACRISNEYINKNAYLIIAGDLVNDIDIANCFYSALIKEIQPNKIIVVLGNHELWDKSFSIEDNCYDIERIIFSYKEMFLKYGINFLQEDLLLIYKEKVEKISARDIVEMDDILLKEYCKDSIFMILGSISFRLQEHIIYNKISTVFKFSKLVCVSHFPIDEDVEGCKLECAWIYIWGHTHKNFFIDSVCKTIYADNQIENPGYIKLKSFSINRKKTNICLSEYEDGVHEIDYRQYLNICANSGISIDFNNNKDDIFLVKKGRFSAFFIKSHKNRKYYLLEGGAIRKIKNQDLDYYYKNIDIYSEKIIKILEPFQETIKNISNEVVSFGGAGTVHGCIVDIDFYNHIYLNPFDLTITNYWAENMSERKVFKNIESLLKYNCYELYQNFTDKFLLNQGGRNSLIAKKDQVVDEKTVSDNSNIYKVSSIIRNMQYLYDCGIVRSWNEEILNMHPKEIDMNKIFFIDYKEK